MTFLYDSAGRGRFLEIEKVVEVTRDCPRVCGVQRKCFFFYATTEEAGRIVQVESHMEEGRSTSTFFYINKKLEEQVFFGFWAEKLGLTKKEFRALIEAHAPN